MVYSIQNAVITFLSELRQVGCFLWVLRFPPPYKTDRHDIAEILLKVALNTINLKITRVRRLPIVTLLQLHTLPSAADTL